MELPKAFMEKYQHLLGEEADTFLAAISEGTPTKGFRLNPLKPAAASMLEKYGPAVSGPAPYASASFLGEVSGKSLLHQAGYVYSQEPSAMIVATAADPQPGERVLDLCAAPGGKSTQLAAAMNNQGLLVANEIFPKRAKILAENLERWGAHNTVVTNHAPQDLVKKFSGFFDRIVVDAPCSGEGMFRKDPIAISEWQAETPAMCAARQKEILTAALQMLRNGGELIYSTCTFAPEENEEIISWLVENYPVTILPIDIAGVSPGRPEWGSVADLEKTVRLWPQKDQGEGHFVAKLRFDGENPPAKVKKAKAAGVTKESLKLWQKLQQQIPFEHSGELVAYGDHLWLQPEGLPDLKGIRVLKAGVQLGVLKKNRMEPAFGLAMAIFDTKGMPLLAIQETDWQKYVAGETFPIPGNLGWVLLQVAEVPVGFGKQVQGTVKNFYPKGLRFHV